MILGKAISLAGQQLLERVQHRLVTQWPDLLRSQLSQLDNGLIPLLTQMLPEYELPLSLEDEEELTAFAFQKRHYDACQLAVHKFIVNSVSQQRFIELPALLQSICLLFVVQQQPASITCRQLDLKGKQDLQEQLREAVRRLLI